MPQFARIRAFRCHVPFLESPTDSSTNGAVILNAYDFDFLDSERWRAVAAPVALPRDDMYLGELLRKLSKPVELPAEVRELLPVSTTRALMAALILFVWSRPTFYLVSYPVRGEALMGWQLTGICPFNWLVPISAAVLLIAAWEGYPRVQAASVAALWLQCIGISIWVPLGAVEGTGWLGTFLLVALISEFRAALLALATQFSLQRTLMRIGAAVLAAPIVVILLLPYWYSSASMRREANPFYVAFTQWLQKEPEAR